MRLLAGVSLLLGCLWAEAQQALVSIADLDRRPAAPALLAGDDAFFYALVDVPASVERLDGEGTLVNLDPIPLMMIVADGSFVTGGGVIAMAGRTESGLQLIAYDRDFHALWKRDFDYSYVSVVFDGSAFVILSAQWETGLSLTRIDRAGNVLGVHAVPDSVHAWGPHITGTGNGVLLVWSGEAAAVASFIGTSGAEENRLTLPRQVGYEKLALASNGVDAVAVWGSGELRAIRFDRHRVIGGPATISYDAELRGRPAAVWDGAMYRIAWRSRTAGRVNAVDLGDGLEFTSFAKFDWPAYPIEYHDDALLAVSAGRVMLAGGGLCVVRAAGEPIRGDVAARPVFLRRTVDTSPAVAWTGDRYVVAWLRITPQYDIEVAARFFDIDGLPLGASFVVAPAASSGAVHLAATRDVVLAAWEYGGRDRGTPGARRFTVEGEMIDAAPIPMDPLTVPDVDFRRSPIGVATDGTDFLMVERDRCDVRVRRLSARGPLTDESRPIVGRCVPPRRGWSFLERGAVTWDGDAYGVVYHTGTIESDAGYTFLTPSLVRVWPDGSASVPITLGEYGEGLEGTPSISAADGHYLVNANSWSPQLVPFDASPASVLYLDTVSPENVEAVAWTGNTHLVVGSGYGVLLTARGHPAARPRPLAGGMSNVNAAGNGCGGAMIVFDHLQRQRMNAHAIVWPCDSSKRRSVR